MIKYNLGVFIGRFQPFHKGHLHNIKSAFERCENILILVGSANKSRSQKNPFTYAERKLMISQDLINIFPNKNVFIEPINDYLYSEYKWIEDVKYLINNYCDDNKNVSLIGHLKDYSSNYLKLFESFNFFNVNNFNHLNATDFRALWYKNHSDENINHFFSSLQTTTKLFLTQFIKTEKFTILKEEYNFILNNKLSGNNNYPMMLPTVDAVVICNNHILTVTSKIHPGKNLLSLPGGYLDKNETVKTSIIKQLKKTTNIDIADEKMKKYLKNIEFFDYPSRSELGRVISFTGIFIVDEYYKNNRNLPSIKSNDNTLDVQWISLETFFKNPNKLLNDYYQIVETLIKNKNYLFQHQCHGS